MLKVGTPALKLFHDFESVFFNHRIRQNLFGDALELFLRFIPVPAIQIAPSFPLGVTSMTEVCARVLIEIWAHSHLKKKSVFAFSTIT